MSGFINRLLSQWIEVIEWLDPVFCSEGMRVIRAPVRAPNANARAERWVGTLRRDCLDRILILNRRHLDRVLRHYVDHFNRPVTSLALAPAA